MSTYKHAFGLILYKAMLIRMFFSEGCLLFLYVFLVGHIYTTSLLEVSLLASNSALARSNSAQHGLTSNSPQGGLYRNFAPNFSSKVLSSFAMMASICLSLRVFSASCKMNESA